MSELRLNKVLAAAGLCSRRKADDLIFSGAVAVNGVPVLEPGARVNIVQDVVSVRGKPLELRKQALAREYSYILLHKPVQVVSTAHDPQGRETVLDLLPAPLRAKRLYPVGRLDYFSEGLILLTNDGELTNRLTHPRYHLPKEYLVRVREPVTPRMLAAMRNGMTLAEGEKLAPVQARVPPDDPRSLHLTLRQGVNRQIRRMCRDLGLTILSLRRIALGPIPLGDLPKGQSRPLSDKEILALKNAVGLRGY